MKRTRTEEATRAVVSIALDRKSTAEQMVDAAADYIERCRPKSEPLDYPPSHANEADAHLRRVKAIAADNRSDDPRNLRDRVGRLSVKIGEHRVTARVVNGRWVGRFGEIPDGNALANYLDAHARKLVATVALDLLNRYEEANARAAADPHPCWMSDAKLRKATKAKACGDHAVHLIFRRLKACGVENPLTAIYDEIRRRVEARRCQRDVRQLCHSE